MLSISLALVLSLFIGRSSSSKLETPGCRIIRDKYDRQNQASRNYLSDVDNRWPNNVVPYRMSPFFSHKDIELIELAMKAIEEVTCVKWVHKTIQKNYVYINSDEKGCFANVGYHPNRGVHILNIQRSDGITTCMIKRIVIHEMLHILGANHEQVRPDRNKYVQINWEHIDRGAYANFYFDIGPEAPERMSTCNMTGMYLDHCWSGYRTNTFGLPYDYTSIMHYALNDFSVTGYPTMTVKKKFRYQKEIGKRTTMSVYDILKLNVAYKCLPRLCPLRPQPKGTTRGTLDSSTYGPTAPDIKDAEMTILDNE